MDPSCNKRQSNCSTEHVLIGFSPKLTQESCVGMDVRKDSLMNLNQYACYPAARSEGSPRHDITDLSRAFLTHMQHCHPCWCLSTSASGDCA